MKTTNRWKSDLDERQERELLRIEHNGCWLAFIGLLAAMIVQQFLYGFDFRYAAGEWVVFMALAVYLAAACLKHGIWDRRLRPNAGTNLVISVIAALGAGLVMFLVVFRRYPDNVFGSLGAGVICAVWVFLLCFAALSLSAWAYKKRRRKLEEEPDEQRPTRGQNRH